MPWSHDPWWSLSYLCATRSDTVLVFHGICHSPVHTGTLQPVWSYIKLYCFPCFVNPALLSGSCRHLSPSTKGLSTTLSPKWHQGECADAACPASAGHGGAAEGVGRNHHFCSPSKDLEIPMGSFSCRNGKTVSQHKPGCHRSISTLRQVLKCVSAFEAPFNVFFSGNLFLFLMHWGSPKEHFCCDSYIFPLICYDTQSYAELSLVHHWYCWVGIVLHMSRTGFELTVFDQHCISASTWLLHSVWKLCDLLLFWLLGILNVTPAILTEFGGFFTTYVFAGILTRC